MTARSWRTVAAVGGLLGLVGVVAVAAAGRAPGGGESRPSAHAPTFAADYLTSAALVLMPVAVVLLMFALALGRSDRVTKGQGRSFRWVLGLFFLAAAVILFTHGPWAGRLHRSGTGSSAVKVKPRKEIKPSGPRIGSRTPQFRWVPVFVIGSLILGIGGAMAVSAVRRKRELLGDIPVAVALSEVLSETLDDLRREVEPRRAVIRAYARMERTLAAHGLPRDRSEAPLEYLTRVLAGVQVSGNSVRRLTQLFQRARFSTHEIDAGMKDDAIEALSGLRAELEVAR